MTLRTEFLFSNDNDFSSFSGGKTKKSPQNTASEQLDAFFRKCADTDTNTTTSSGPVIKFKYADELADEPKDPEISAWLKDLVKKEKSEIKQIQKELAAKTHKPVSDKAAHKEYKIRFHMKYYKESRAEAEREVEQNEGKPSYSEECAKRVQQCRNAVQYAKDKNFNPRTKLGFSYRSGVRFWYHQGVFTYDINGKSYTPEQVDEALKEVEEQYKIDRFRFHSIAGFNPTD